MNRNGAKQGLWGFIHPSQLLRINYVLGCILGTDYSNDEAVAAGFESNGLASKVDGMHTSQKFNDHGKGNHFPLVSLCFRYEETRGPDSSLSVWEYWWLEEIKCLNVKGTSTSVFSSMPGPRMYSVNILFGRVKITDDSFLSSFYFIYSVSILWLLLCPETRPELCARHGPWVHSIC